MNSSTHSHKTARKAGMTLLETMIAIGVIAIAVPLVLAATTASLADRRSAEAETKSAWLARDLKDQVAALWASPRLKSYLPDSLVLDFPAIGTDKDPMIFIYDGETKFISMGTKAELQSGSQQNGAKFLVTLYSTSQLPTNLASTNTPLSRLFIKVQYPAKAPIQNRQTNQYSIVAAKQQPF